MTSGNFFENRLFYMKYIGNYLSIERLLWMYSSHKFICMYIGVYKTPAHSSVTCKYYYGCFSSRFRFMVFNATFNNISIISWQSVLLVEETRVPGENHRPVVSHWQTLSHNVVSSTRQQWPHNLTIDRLWLHR
jgi:hypothetical protein